MQRDGGNAEGHPFHIHVSSFEVKQIDQIARPPGTIMDALWTGVGQSAVIWLHFKQWTGKAVYTVTSCRTKTPA